jgi:hypothetical protein
MRRQIRYVAWHMEDARAAAKNDGRLLFHRAAEGKRGEEALLAIGEAYIDEMLTDPIRLPGQMHGYLASSDPEIREVVRIGHGDLVAYTEQVSGASPRADLELPRHRHAAERPRLNAGAGRRRKIRSHEERLRRRGLDRSYCSLSSSVAAQCSRSLPEDAAALAGSPVAHQRARVTRSSTRAANGMCGERQTCRSSNGHA